MTPCRLTLTSFRTYVLSIQLSAISLQLSAISGQLYASLPSSDNPSDGYYVCPATRVDNLRFLVLSLFSNSFGF